MNTHVLRRLLLAAVSVASLAWGKIEVFEQLSDGSLWEYTGTPCQGNVCSGWVEVDSGNNTLYAASGGGQLYQLRNDFSIWKFVGPACTPPSQGLVCAGWEQLDNNPQTAGIFAGNGDLYQAHIDGTIWYSTGQSCNGGSCGGWKLFGNDANGLAYTAGADLIELRTGGELLEYDGGGGCCYWGQLDSNPNTVYAISGTTGLYQIENSGAISQYTGKYCSGHYCPYWQTLDNNPGTAGIVAGDNLYQIHKNHSIWSYTGTPCNASGCPGWAMLDNNPSTTTISAGKGTVYQQHANGTIWESTGQPCSGNFCPGWLLIGNKPGGHLLVNNAGYVR
jgi:hypothetical protein